MGGNYDIAVENVPINEIMIIKQRLDYCESKSKCPYFVQKIYAR